MCLGTEVGQGFLLPHQNKLSHTINIGLIKDSFFAEFIYLLAKMLHS